MIDSQNKVDKLRRLIQLESTVVTEGIHLLHLHLHPSIHIHPSILSNHGNVYLKTLEFNNRLSVFYAHNFLSK